MTSSVLENLAPKPRLRDSRQLRQPAAHGDRFVKLQAAGVRLRMHGDFRVTHHVVEQVLRAVLCRASADSSSRSRRVPNSVSRNSQMRSISSAGQPWKVESVMLRLKLGGIVEISQERAADAAIDLGGG